MLTGKKVVVVGGATGVGFAVAQQALCAGAEVVIASRSQERLRSAADLLGPGASAELVDAEDAQSVRAFFARVGQYDHLAITVKPRLDHQRFLDSDLLAVRAAFDTKFWGQYRLLQHATATIRAHGSIVLTSGIAARRSSAGLSAAGAMNAATEALAQALAIELAPIRINTVSPGLVAKEGAAARAGLLGGLAQYVPLKREGASAEVANAFLYLFGNSYATGSVIVVDGGALC